MDPTCYQHSSTFSSLPKPSPMARPFAKPKSMKHINFASPLFYQIARLVLVVEIGFEIPQIVGYLGFLCVL